MPVTPEEQAILDKITENLHGRGLIQELPWDDEAVGGLDIEPFETDETAVAYEPNLPLR